jgi:hypothetical protein
MDQMSPQMETVADKAITVMGGLLSWRSNIEKAMKAADWSHTFDDITYMVLSGQLEFHDFEDCYCLTQITVFPQFKLYHFMLAGGNLEEIINLTEHFKAKARALDCKYLSFSGRKGFEPVLSKAGWTHRFTTMWLEVDQ